MDIIRKVTTAAAIAVATTFSGSLLIGCEEGYEAEEVEGLEGVDEGIEEQGELMEEETEEFGEGVEELGE